MKYFTWLLFIVVIIYSVGCASQQYSLYFDQNGKAVTEEQQRNIFNRNRSKLIPATVTKGDSIEYHLVPRKEAGRLKQEANQEIVNYLSGKSPNSLTEFYLAVIIYYPGKDLNNSSGSATRESYAAWYDEMEEKLEAVGGVITFYVYKNNEGLEKQTLNRKWYEDNDHLVEKNFFKYHYPGGSFIVVDQSGNYRSYFGEYSKELVVETAMKMRRLE